MAEGDHDNSRLAMLQHQGLTAEDEREARMGDLEMTVGMLQRQLPVIRDKNGKDISKEIVVMCENLQSYKQRVEVLEAENSQYKRIIGRGRSMLPGEDPSIIEFGDQSTKADASTRTVAAASAPDVNPYHDLEAEVQLLRDKDMAHEVEMLQAKKEIDRLKTDKANLNKLVTGLRRNGGVDLTMAEPPNPAVVYGVLDKLNPNWRKLDNFVRFLDSVMTGRNPDFQEDFQNLVDMRQNISQKLGALYESTMSLNASVSKIPGSTFEPAVVADVRCDFDMIDKLNTTTNDRDLATACLAYHHAYSCLFESMRSVADFLLRLVTELDNETDPRIVKLVEQINAYRQSVDLNLTTATEAVGSATNESIVGALDQSLATAIAPSFSASRPAQSFSASKATSLFGDSNPEKKATYEKLANAVSVFEGALANRSSIIVDTHLAEITELRQKIATLEEEKTVLKSEVDSATSTKQDIESQLASVTAELQKVDRDRQNLQVAFQKTEQQSASERAELSFRLNEVIAEREALEAKLNDLNAKLEAERVQTNDRLQAKESELCELARALDEKERAVADYADQLAKLNAVIEDLRAKLDSQSQILEKNKENAAVPKKHTAEIVDQLQKMHSVMAKVSKDVASVKLPANIKVVKKK